MEQKELNLHLLKYLLISYVVTAILLIVLSFLLYWFQLSPGAVSIGIIVIYIIACLAAGILAGGKAGHHKYLYGLLMGIAYFMVLMVISMIVDKGKIQMNHNFVTVLCLCSGSGMLGGMISK